MFTLEIPELIIDVDEIRKFVLELDPYQWEPMRRSKGLLNWPMRMMLGLLMFYRQ